MTFMRTFYQKWNQEKADELLSFFELQTNDKIKELSKGNQSKVSILLGITQDADFYLMDEPLSPGFPPTHNYASGVMPSAS